MAPIEPYSKPIGIEKVFPNLDGKRLPTIADVSGLIKDGKVKNVVIMAGAGISTAAGIPDFRTPGTGLYSNLEKYNLPYAEAIFDIDYFKQHPEAFYALARELNPGRYKPTITHRFFRLLEKKGILKKCFTQNIDTLERLSGVSEELIVEAHGSFATAKCLNCGAKVSSDDFMDRLSGAEKPMVRCLQSSCEGNPKALVKPDIVFFGEGLPSRFFSALSEFTTADLLIVLGTSLQVQPFASLISTVPLNCPRVLINLEAVGKMGKHGNEGGFDFKGLRRGGREFVRDVLVQGTTDDGVRKLCQLLGWTDELLDLHVPSRSLQSIPPLEGSSDSSSKSHTQDSEQPASHTVPSASATPSTVTEPATLTEPSNATRPSTVAESTTLAEPSAKDESSTAIEPSTTALPDGDEIDRLTCSVAEVAISDTNTIEPGAKET